MLCGRLRGVSFCEFGEGHIEEWYDFVLCLPQTEDGSQVFCFSWGLTTVVGSLEGIWTIFQHMWLGFGFQPTLYIDSCIQRSWSPIWNGKFFGHGESGSKTISCLCIEKKKGPKKGICFGYIYTSLLVRWFHNNADIAPSRIMKDQLDVADVNPF